MVNPIFHLELLLGFEEIDNNTGEEVNPSPFKCQLTFNKSVDSIQRGMEDFFFELVECFNTFNRPEFCKITLQP